MTFPLQTLAPMVGSTNLSKVPSLVNGLSLVVLLVVLTFVVIIIGHGAEVT